MMNELEQKQDAVLGLLSGKIDDYYLAGGTALARFYFHHRESADLDFFTKHYDINQIAGIMNYLSTEIGIKANLLSAQTPFDYQIMEKHFKNEIDKIIEKELS